MKTRLLAGAALALALGFGPASADVTVRLLHVSTVGQTVWSKIADDYNKAHPGVKVVVEYLENEAYKAKLPTLLQSEDKPAIIYSWGGGVMRAQIEAGYIEDISAAKPDFDKTVSAGGLGAYVVGGKLYGVPHELSEVGLFYNKALLEKAAVDPASMATWDGFIAAVKKLKAAGITPIVMGGGEKWPMHFYWSYLVMRLGGADVLTNAEAGKDGGFKNPIFAEAGKKLKELSDLQPYQEGWLSTLFPASGGMFGDGKGAIDLMGSWLLNTQKENAADGKGLSIDQIGFAPFPTLPGGKGQVTDTLGGLQGFLVTKGAPPEAVDFLKFLSTVNEEKEAASSGAYIPAVKGTDGFIANPLLSQIAKNVANSTWHQNFFDQDLGPAVGRVVNDSSVAIAAGDLTPEDAAAAIQEAWDQR
jgi:raffinose/stachyose/melibiose transport system substrate-binding protein